MTHSPKKKIKFASTKCCLPKGCELCANVGLLVVVRCDSKLRDTAIECNPFIN